MRMLRNVLSIMSARRAGSLASAMFLATMLTGAATAETAIKFSLDFSFEGPSAPFLLPLDKGYYKAEGLDVSIDTAANSLEPISRVASGAYDMGFGDINSLIKFRDANPGMPIKAVFVLYNRPPFAIVGRKSRGVSAPKDLEGKKLGAPARSATALEIDVQQHGDIVDRHGTAPRCQAGSTRCIHSASRRGSPARAAVRCHRYARSDR